MWGVVRGDILRVVQPGDSSHAHVQVANDKYTAEPRLDVVIHLNHRSADPGGEVAATSVQRGPVGRVVDPDDTDRLEAQPAKTHTENTPGVRTEQRGGDLGVEHHEANAARARRPDGIAVCGVARGAHSHPLEALIILQQLHKRVVMVVRLVDKKDVHCHTRRVSVGIHVALHIAELRGGEPSHVEARQPEDLLPARAWARGGAIARRCAGDAPASAGRRRSDTSADAASHNLARSTSSTSSRGHG